MSLGGSGSRVTFQLVILACFGTFSTEMINFWMKVNMYIAEIRDWSLVTGRGATKWEYCRSKTGCPPSFEAE